MFKDLKPSVNDRQGATWHNARVSCLFVCENRDFEGKMVANILCPDITSNHDEKLSKLIFFKLLILGFETLFVEIIGAV